jgi:hypothetical protein
VLDHVLSSALGRCEISKREMFFPVVFKNNDTNLKSLCEISKREMFFPVVFKMIQIFVSIIEYL